MTKLYKVEEKIIIGPKGDKLKLVVESGQLPSFLKRRKIQRSPPPEVFQLIYDVQPEFKRIWNAVKALPGSVSRNILKQQKEAALTCFDAHSDWKHIPRRALESPHPWKGWRGGHEKETFRGKLLQEILAVHFSDLPDYGCGVLEKIAKGFETVPPHIKSGAQTTTPDLSNMTNAEYRAYRGLTSSGMRKKE